KEEENGMVVEVEDHFRVRVDGKFMFLTKEQMRDTNLVLARDRLNTTSVADYRRCIHKLPDDQRARYPPGSRITIADKVVIVNEAFEQIPFLVEVYRRELNLLLKERGRMQNLATLEKEPRILTTLTRPLMQKGI